MPLSNKIRQDWAPILFFGLFIATKTYYLIIYVTSSEDLWGLLGNNSPLHPWAFTCSRSLWPCR